MLSYSLSLIRESRGNQSALGEANNTRSSSPSTVRNGHIGGRFLRRRSRTPTQKNEVLLFRGDHAPLNFASVSKAVAVTVVNHGAAINLSAWSHRRYAG